MIIFSFKFKKSIITNDEKNSKVYSNYYGKFNFQFIHRKTRMTTFMKTKFMIPDEQTNIDKYRVATNITV